ncbi:hypothetical protein HRbin30_02675 [bacterium HR30]|nr:hypothetical protein HRbin30_02675 [bacterium HR30]
MQLFADGSQQNCAGRAPKRRVFHPPWQITATKSCHLAACFDVAWYLRSPAVAMEDARLAGCSTNLDPLLRWPSRGIRISPPQRRRRGRPPGISPQRQAILARWVKQGLSLGQIAQRLGVSRQCIHIQLRKCPELEALRRDSRARLMALRRAEKQELAGWEALFRKRRGGREFVKFLLEARSRGWHILLHPRKRPRVNGVPLAFHRPARLRRASQGGASKARYYHVRITHPDWVNVVCLPSGKFLISPPGSIPRAGSLYIPLSQDDGTTHWPLWPQETLLSQSAA